MMSLIVHTYLNSHLSTFNPFRPNPDGRTVYENVYAWNKEAHMLYIDSPRNVGFSYGEDKKDHTYSDDLVTYSDGSNRVFEG